MPVTLARWALEPVVGPDAEHAAREELSKAEYHRDDPSFVDRFLNWVGRRIDWLFSGGPGGNALLVLLVLVAAVVIFAIVRAGPPRRVARLLPGEQDPLRPLAAADHRRLAAEHAEAGRHAEALREWLRAAVQTIEERGVLTVRPGRTGAATAREAGPILPAAAADLSRATAAFDEVWFGGRAATATDVAAARAAAEQVVTARVAEAVAPPAGYALPW